jgi:hypothetical protein
MLRLCRSIATALLFGCVLVSPSLGAQAPSNRPVQIVLDPRGKTSDVELLPKQVFATQGSGADILATVTASSQKEAGTSYWIYSYLVSNATNSPRGIWSLTLESVPSPVAITGPSGWRIDSAFRAPGQLNWFSIDAGPNPPSDGNVGPSPSDIAPGQSQTFSFKTTYPPQDSALTFYVQGVAPIPVSSDTAEADEDSLVAAQGDFLADSYQGRILGPSQTVGVEANSRQAQTALGIASPNPTRGWSAFRFSLCKPAHARLLIFDAAGREMRNLFNGDLPVGDHLVIWDGRDGRGRPVASGNYFYQLAVDGSFIGSRKLLVIR